MIYLYHQEIDEVWYATAVEDEKVFATAFSFSERGVLRRLLENLPYNMPFQMAEKSIPLSMELLKTLKTIFDGKDVSFSFQLALDHLPSYTRGVLKCVSLIPVGYVTTYGAIAKTVGASSRAVGRVMATNPFPLLIPCHRVVRSDFSVGGYGLGGEVKLRILQREDRDYEEAARLKINDKALPLFAVKRVLECLFR